MKKCFIIDIDGTVADGTHRLHHILKSPKDWDAFFLACGDDEPIAHMHMVVTGLCEHAQIVFVSGRSDLVRDQTVTWLNEHGFPCDALYMRKQGDHRDDTVIKVEMLAQLRADGFDPIMAFDDRNRVVQAWRAAGVPCAQVAEGDF